MKENKFQKQVVKQLESQAAFIFNVHGHMIQKSGLPDLLVIHTRWKGWLELKCEKYKASSLQRIKAAMLELREMPVYILRCVEIKYGDTGKKNCIGCLYTLENFQGDIIKEFADLGLLLDILCELELDKWNGD